MFSVKSQRVNIFDLAGPMVSVTTTQLGPCPCINEGSWLCYHTTLFTDTKMRILYNFHISGDTILLLIFFFFATI